MDPNDIPDDDRDRMAAEYEVAARLAVMARMRELGMPEPTFFEMQEFLTTQEAGDKEIYYWKGVPICACIGYDYDIVLDRLKAVVVEV